MRLILASNSPRRRELLEQVGISFQVLPSSCEENCSVNKPEELVEELARQKAQNVAERVEKELFEKEKPDLVFPGENTRGKPAEGIRPPIIILGADTVVALDGQILGKPKDEKQAFQMLQALQGHSHQVYSGVALILLSRDTGHIGRTKTFHVKTQVDVYPMTEEEIHRYIATGEPMDKAGAYGIQGSFAAYIKGIVGDYYNVVGLPISRLVHELREFDCYFL